MLLYRRLAFAFTVEAAIRSSDNYIASILGSADLKDILIKGIVKTRALLTQCDLIGNSSSKQ